MAVTVSKSNRATVIFFAVAAAALIIAFGVGIYKNRNVNSGQISTKSVIDDYGPYLCQSAIENRFGEKPSIIKKDSLTAKLEVYKGSSYHCEYAEKAISIIKDGEEIKHKYTIQISAHEILLVNDNDISFQFATINTNEAKPNKKSREKTLSDSTAQSAYDKFQSSNDPVDEFVKRCASKSGIPANNPNHAITPAEMRAFTNCVDRNKGAL